MKSPDPSVALIRAAVPSCAGHMVAIHWQSLSSGPNLIQRCEKKSLDFSRHQWIFKENVHIKVGNLDSAELYDAFDASNFY